jgi:hypothetical protein
MAKISNEFKLTLRNLQQALLDIVDDAKAAEFILLERFGETNQTVVVLDELTAIAQQGSDLFTYKYLDYCYEQQKYSQL